MSGRVTASHLALGRSVKAGDVLVELDAETETRRLEEERQRLAAIGPQLVALRREVIAFEQSLHDDCDATRVALDGARAKRSEAETAARFAEEEGRRLALLKETGGIAELELLRARAEGEKRRATASAVALEVTRLDGDQRTRDSQGRARLEQQRREMAVLEGSISTTTASVALLAEAVEKRRIRAPVTGQLGEVAPLQVGSVLREGERLGTVVPSGKLRVVAGFAPTALGRVKVGQLARVRLDSFPWTAVGHAAGARRQRRLELRQGHVRVELSVAPDARTAIPLQHGLPGSVEVEVEQVSPAILVLRAAGRQLASPVVPPGTARPDLVRAP